MRTRRATASAALLLGLLAGCGAGSVEEAGRLAPVAAVQRAAEAAGSESARYTLELTGTGVNVRGSGAFRGGADPAAEMAFDRIEALGATLGQGFEYRMIGKAVYLKLGDEWQKMPVDGAANFGPVDSSALTDPMGSLRRMLDTDDVTEVGSETVDGVETTHYRARTKTSGLFGAAPETSPAPGGLGSALEKSLRDRLGTMLGGGTAQADVWVDAQYRARRFVLSLPTLGDMKLTVNVRDYGAPVRVEVPSDASEFDVDGLNLDALTGNGLPEDLLGADFGKLLGGDVEELLGEDFGRSLGEDLARRLGRDLADEGITG